MDSAEFTYRFEESQYRIVRLSANAISDVRYLFSHCFGTDPGEEAIRQKHEHCHGTHKYIGYLAYPVNSEIPAAFYAVFPTYLTDSTSTILGAQSGDTMTHPEHQKKGLFVFLAEKTFALCSSLDIQVVFGFPNNQSYPGFIKRLNFTSLPNLVDFTLLENRLEMHRWLSKSTWTRKLQNSWTHFLFRLLTKSYPNFQRAIYPSFFQVCYDYEYFNSKSGSYRWIAISESTFWIKIQGNTLMIGAMSFSNPTVLKKALNWLRVLTFLSGNRFLTFSASPNHPIGAVMKELKLTPMGARQRVIVRNLKSTPISGELIFTCSDIDVF
jgi:hypothetical protein